MNDFDDKYKQFTEYMVAILMNTNGKYDLLFRTIKGWKKYRFVNDLFTAYCDDYSLIIPILDTWLEREGKQ